jgi:gamma-glutamylcyclotransferase (GGCT)/AIG2-like uncharacterized protein YtfP
MPHSTFQLFTYGTLRRGGGAHHVLEGCTFIDVSVVRGTLYDIDGEYPALMPYGHTSVPGEVWRCPAPLLHRLDAYEGVDHGLFRRIGFQAGDHACWMYVAGPALSRRLTPARRIDSGRWPRVRAAG